MGRRRRKKETTEKPAPLKRKTTSTYESADSDLEEVFSSPFPSTSKLKKMRKMEEENDKDKHKKKHSEKSSSLAGDCEENNLLTGIIFGLIIFYHN